MKEHDSQHIFEEFITEKSGGVFYRHPDGFGDEAQLLYFEYKHPIIRQLWQDWRTAWKAAKEEG